MEARSLERVKRRTAECKYCYAPPPIKGNAIDARNTRRGGGEGCCRRHQTVPRACPPPGRRGRRGEIKKWTVDGWLFNALFAGRLKDGCRTVVRKWSREGGSSHLEPQLWCKPVRLNKKGSERADEAKTRRKRTLRPSQVNDKATKNFTTQ